MPERPTDDPVRSPGLEAEIVESPTSETMPETRTSDRNSSETSKVENPDAENRSAEDRSIEDWASRDHVTADPRERYPEVVFRSLAVPLVYVLLAVGLHFFLRGHNAPGGGFVAGLIIAVTALLARMARGARLLTVSPQLLVPLGLLVAFVTGVVPMFFGAAFLKSAYGYLEWPLLGEFEWASAALFDLGVFLVVVGTTLTIINLLAEDRGAPGFERREEG